MQNNKYLVVGLGVTGLSVVAFLCKHNLNVTVNDSRAEPPQLQDLQQQFPQVPVLLGSFNIPAEITHIILSPGVALDTPEVQAALQRGVEVIGDIELFARKVTRPVLGITGSNGKSTVTTLLGEMARASGLQTGVGGNLGTAALDLLDPDNECYVLELSSFQLETTHSLQPKVVTFLNLSPDHMDRYADVAAYQAAKQRIFINAEYAVVNRQDPLTWVPDHLNVPMRSFGLDAPDADNYGVIVKDQIAWLAKGQQLLMPTTEMGMLGAHNVANALAALAMGELAGFSLDAMLATLRRFTGLEHRCEKITQANNIVWVNDSKGTNVASTLAAIEGLGKSITGKWIIILGGLGKNADFTPLVQPILNNCKAAILIGTAADEFWQLLHTQLPCYRAVDLTEVVNIALEIAQPGDGVLLSPACASWDMFENYIQRGRLFKQEVRQRTEHANTEAALANP
jgi:UDP-N-acetylmuramoylalanine--D-glutamate ligase